MCFCKTHIIGSFLSDHLPLIGYLDHLHLMIIDISSVQFRLVAQVCTTLCDPMNYSMPGLPIHHQLPEFTQIHVHRVDDAIQPSHPLSSPAPPVLRMRWPKYWSFSFRISPSKEHPGLISFRVDWWDLLAAQPTH